MADPPSESRTQLRPTRPARVAGIAFGTFGVLFALSAVAADDAGAAVVVAVAGLVFATGGFGAARTHVWVEPGLLIARNWRTTRVPVSAIESLEIVPSGGWAGSVLAVRRHGVRRPLKLVASTTWDSARGAARLRSQADLIRTVAGLGAP